jgi:phytoene synthase
LKSLGASRTEAERDRRHVRQVVTRSGSSFLWGMRVLARPRRNAIYAIYAYCREIDDIADEPGAEATKLAALAAWREEIERLYAGVPTRPTSRALLGPLRAYDLPKEEFLALIDGMEMDAREAMVAPSMDQLELYCRRVAGAVGMLSIKAFGARDPVAPELAVVLGEAFQLINILRDLAEDAARGRLYLPREALERHGVSWEDPRSALADPAVARVCAELGALARRRLTRGQELLARCEPGAVKPCVVMMAVYGRLLSRLEDRGWDQLEAPVRVSALEKAWIALRHGLF